jgi:hypothetical protein
MNILNLEDSSAELYRKIKEKGRLSISKLTNAEIFDAMKLSDEGLIKFDRTPKGNPSRFLVTKEDA